MNAPPAWVGWTSASSFRLSVLDLLATSCRRHHVIINVSSPRFAPPQRRCADAWTRAGHKPARTRADRGGRFCSKPLSKDSGVHLHSLYLVAPHRHLSSESQPTCTEAPSARRGASTRLPPQWLRERINPLSAGRITGARTLLPRAH